MNCFALYPRTAVIYFRADIQRHHVEYDYYDYINTDSMIADGIAALCADLFVVSTICKQVAEYAVKKLPLHRLSYIKLVIFV